MIFGNLKKDSSPIQLIFFLLIVFISILVFSFIGSLFGIFIFGQEAMSTNIYEEGTNVSIIRYLQGVSQVGAFLIPPLIFAFLFYEAPKNYFSFKIERKEKLPIILFILLFLISVPIVEWLSLFNQSFSYPEWLSGFEQYSKSLSEKSEIIISKMLSDKSIIGLFGNIVIIGLLPAFSEELFFRGVLQQLLIKWTKKQHLSVIIIAIIFSAIHLDFMNFIPRVFLGLILGYAFLYTKTIWTPILIHLINNTSSVLFYYFSSEEVSSNVYYFDGKITPLIISIAASFFIIFIIRKQLLKQNLFVN